MNCKISNKYLVYLVFILLSTNAYALDGNQVVKLRINDTDIATGFFIDQDGTIATAYHAICGYSGQLTKKIEVIDDRNRNLGKPHVVGYDSLRDVALLKIANPPKFRFTKVCTVDEVSEQMQQGQSGLAFGFPDGKPLFDVSIRTTRKSFITAKDYVFPNNQKFFSYKARHVKLIPFHGPISKGMSGGPLVLNGQIIGIISGTQAIQGDTFGWAIPVGAVFNIVEEKSIAFEDLEPLDLIRFEKANDFIKGMRHVDLGELSGIEVLCIGEAEFWERIEQHSDLKRYFDRGIKFRQITAKTYDESIIRHHYLRMKQMPNFNHKIDFQMYHKKRNDPYSSKDLRIYRDYNIKETPVFIGYYNKQEIARYNGLQNVLQYLFWRKKGVDDVATPDDFGFESEERREEFISFLNILIDTAKKEKYATSNN